MGYTAQCACGTVRIEAAGEPVIQCYCHCTRCRSASGAPVNAVALWPRDHVRFIAGEDSIGRYSGGDDPEGGRFFCTRCGGALGADLPRIGMYDIFAGLVPDLDFRPTIHLNYENAVLPMKDGLPKLKDMPEGSGGTGAFMPE